MENESGCRGTDELNLRVKIHRGTHEIGGNCVEIESAGYRVVLDLGRPLDAPHGADVPPPPIAGLDGTDPSLLGILISHAHQDHYGLAAQVAGTVPLYVGEAASRILRVADVFGCAGLSAMPAGALSDRRPLDLGPFRITPFLVDHSAFDSYSLLVEAGGKRLFYTGDFRATGAKGRLFYRLLRKPPAPVDVLLMEGTNLRAGASPPATCRTERDVKMAIKDTVASARGMVLVAYSGQNIDRLCSVFGAARACRRELVVDLYTAIVAAATGNPRIPQPGFDGFRVYVPHSQRRRILQTKRFDLVEKVRRCRVYERYINAHARQLVVTFRKSVEPMLEGLPAAALEDALAVWSQWHGYLDRDPGMPTLDFCGRHGIPLVEHHTSGHAGLAELRKLAAALNPRRVVPIHTEAPAAFAQHFANVELHADGESWEV